MKCRLILTGDGGEELAQAVVTKIPEDLLTRPPSVFNDRRQDAVWEKVNNTFTSLYFQVATREETSTIPVGPIRTEP